MIEMLNNSNAINDIDDVGITKEIKINPAAFTKQKPGLINFLKQFSKGE